MTNCKVVSTPFVSGQKFYFSDGENLYQFMHQVPDIMHYVSMLFRFIQSSNKECLKGVKPVLLRKILCSMGKQSNS